MSSDEEDLNKLAIRGQVLGQQGQALQNQLEAMQETIADINATIETLENLPKAKEEGRLPIGSGVYITCQKINTDNVYVSVGAGFIVSKKLSEAQDILRKRLAAVSEGFDKSQKNLVLVNRQLQDVNAQANAIAARMENVRPAEG